MEFTEVIEKRYSCKKFDGRKVDDAQLKAILEAGRLAPTAKNLQEQDLSQTMIPERNCLRRFFIYDVWVNDYKK